MNLKIPPYMIISTQAPLGPPLPCSSSPAATAEAPELSYGEVCFTEWCVKINQYKIQNVGIYWTIVILSLTAATAVLWDEGNDKNDT